MVFDVLWYNANKGGDQMIPYEVIEAKEILHEGVAELLADIFTRIHCGNIVFS